MRLIHKRIRCRFGENEKLEKGERRVVWEYSNREMRGKKKSEYQRNNWIWKRSTGRKIKMPTKSVMHHCANTHRTEMIPRWRPALRGREREWVSKKNRHHIRLASKRECRMKEKLMKCLQFGSCIYMIWILPMRIKFNFILFCFFLFSRWFLHNDPCCFTTNVSCTSLLIIMIAVVGGVSFNSFPIFFAVIRFGSITLISSLFKFLHSCACFMCAVQ